MKVLLRKKQEITKAYSKIVDLFKNNLANSSKTPSQHGGNLDSGSVAATTQDILILLLPHLSASDATMLFHLCLSNNIIGGKDNGVQKRGYKILAKLVESDKVSIDAERILRQLDELVDGLAPAAKKVASLYCRHAVADIQTGSVYFVIFTDTSNPVNVNACYPVLNP